MSLQTRALAETVAIIVVVYGLASLMDRDPTHFMIGLLLYFTSRTHRIVAALSGDTEKGDTP